MNAEGPLQCADGKAPAAVSAAVRGWGWPGFAFAGAAKRGFCALTGALALFALGEVALNVRLLAAGGTGIGSPGNMLLVGMEAAGLFLLAVFPGRRGARGVALGLLALVAAGLSWWAWMECRSLVGMVRWGHLFSGGWNVHLWVAAASDVAGMAARLAFVAFWGFHAAGNRGWRTAMAWTAGGAGLAWSVLFWGLVAASGPRCLPTGLWLVAGATVLRALPWFMVALFEGKGGAREA